MEECFVTNFDQNALFRAACAAREHAYAPYSGFRVGAALLCADGRIFTGCNVENAAYPLCTCAERTALCAAVAQGARQFAAIAIAGGRDEDCAQPCMPCGGCRQNLAEFCGPDFPVILSDGIHTLGQLLPGVFRLRQH